MTAPKKPDTCTAFATFCVWVACGAGGLVVGPLAAARLVVAPSAPVVAAAAELKAVEFMAELRDIDVLLVEFAAAPSGIVVK